MDGFGLQIRLIIPREVELIPRNALWHLLSGMEKRIEYGLQHCQLKDRELFGIFENQLERSYTKEGIIMPITVEDYRRGWREQLLAEATLEEISENLTPEQLAGLMTSEQLAELKPEQLAELPREQLLAGLGIKEEDIQGALRALGLDKKSDDSNS